MGGFKADFGLVTSYLFGLAHGVCFLIETILPPLSRSPNRWTWAAAGRFVCSLSIRFWSSPINLQDRLLFLQTPARFFFSRFIFRGGPPIFSVPHEIVSVPRPRILFPRKMFGRAPQSVFQTPEVISLTRKIIPGVPPKLGSSLFSVERCAAGVPISPPQSEGVTPL